MMTNCKLTVISGHVCVGGVSLTGHKEIWTLQNCVYFYLKQNRIQYSQSDSGVVIYSFSALAYSNRIFTFLIISIYEDISQAAGPISFCPRKVRQEATAMFVAWVIGASPKLQARSSPEQSLRCKFLALALQEQWVVSRSALAWTERRHRQVAVSHGGECWARQLSRKPWEALVRRAPHPVVVRPLFPRKWVEYGCRVSLSFSNKQK